MLDRAASDTLDSSRDRVDVFDDARGQKAQDNTRYVAEEESRANVTTSLAARNAGERKIRAGGSRVFGEIGNHAGT